MKSVLLLLPGAFSGVGGIEMYNRQLVRAFLELGLERGFRVRTLVLNDRTADVDDRYIPAGTPSPEGCRRGRGRFVVGALRAVASDPPDLVFLGHVHFARLAPFLRFLAPRARFWGVAYGIDVWRPLSASVRRGLALAETVFSISTFSAHELELNGGVPSGRISLLPCALDEVWRGQYAPRPGDPAGDGRPASLLTVARLAATERYKGVDSVLRALAETARRVPDVSYDIVGDGDDRLRLEAVARDAGVAGRVRFRGRLWPDELAAAYRDCSLFAMPSSKEGFGIVFLEAALFGKPSIGGRHGGTPEVIEDGVTGLLCDREDVSGIADSITRLLVRDDERRAMGEAASRRLADFYTYERFRSNLASRLDA